MVVLKMAAAKLTECPFSEKGMGEAREAVRQATGLGKEKVAIVEKQPLYLDLVMALLRLAGDPDWGYFETLKSGVDLGVNEPMPRTPNVYEEKLRWTLDPGEASSTSEQEN